MNKRTLQLFIFLCALFASTVSCSRLADICAFKTLKVVYISNDADAGAVPFDTKLYATGDIVTLAGNTGGLAKSGSTFTGWSLRADSSGPIYQPGATIVIGSEDLMLWAVFSSNPPTTIDLLAIPGVTVPVNGATPVTSIETSQYTGVVSWSPTVSDMFVSNTVYTATITITPKAGYTLTGVAANSFSVTGMTSASNSVDSGVVTVVFPISTANLSMTSDLVSTTIGTLKAVQGGTFNNGTANMTVSSFRISQYEITGTQYAIVMGTDPSNFSSVIDHPVEKVNWYHAIAFCNKLSILEGLTPAYSVKVGGIEVDWANINHGGIPISSNSNWNNAVCNWGANGYRLPTEAEWEFAARGGNNTHNYTYAGSNTIGDVGWYTTNSGATTHRIGTKSANELGLYDMTGNIREWCWDWNNTYPTTDQIDYHGTNASFRTIRGGSAGRPDSQCTVSYRDKEYPYYRNEYIGFRVLRQ